MKYKVSDKVKVKVTIKEPTQEITKGDICTVIDIFPNDIYQVSDEAGHHWLFVEKMLESAVPTLTEIREKKLTCVVHTPTRNGAEIIVNTIPIDDEGTIDHDWSSLWDTYKDNTCYKIVDGELYSYQNKEFFENNSYTIYEFSDLFPVGSAAICGDCVYQRTESGIKNYKLVPEYKEGGVVTLKPRDESVSFASAPYLDLSNFILPTNSREFEEKFNEELAKHFNASSNGFRGGKKPEYVLNEQQAKEYADNIIATAESISHITSIPYENSINKLRTCLSAFSNDGISAKNGGKNSMKFTFYVTEGTRVDKSCNGTIPTMTTTVTNGLDEVSVTCDKVDFNERQGVLEGIAQLYCKGRFDKEYEAAVKINKRDDKANRTCIYCGKIFDTAEERAEHEKWHVERKKARRERYLLRKRAKEIAFEEQAQKMAKEMMGEQK